jgi:WD40 repeat protein
VTTIFAQNFEIPLSEPITSDNVDSLEILANWQGVENSFVTASFNSDSSLLALVLNDGVIQLLSFPSLEPYSTLDGVDFEATQVKFSRDNSRLMLSDFYGNYGFWEVDTGEIIGEYTHDSDEWWGDVDSDLKFLVTLNEDNTVVIRETITGNEQLSVEQVASFPRPLLSPDGSLLLTVDTEGFLTWDVDTGTVTYQFSELENTELSSFGFSPDGQLIWANWRDWQFGRDISENRSIIEFWNTTDGSEFTRMSGGGSHIRMYFSQSGNLVATAGDDDQLQSAVWVWDMKSSELLGEAGIPTGGGVAGFNPDGSLLAVASGTATGVQFWDANSPEIPAVASINIQSGTVVPPAFSADGRYLLTVGYDVRVWGVPSNE